MSIDLTREQKIDSLELIYRAVFGGMRPKIEAWLDANQKESNSFQKERKMNVAEQFRILSTLVSTIHPAASAAEQLKAVLQLIQLVYMAEFATKEKTPTLSGE